MIARYCPFGWQDCLRKLHTCYSRPSSPCRCRPRRVSWRSRKNTTATKTSPPPPTQREHSSPYSPYRLRFFSSVCKESRPLAKSGRLCYSVKKKSLSPAIRTREASAQSSPLKRNRKCVRNRRCRNCRTGREAILSPVLFYKTPPWEGGF